MLSRNLCLWTVLFLATSTLAFGQTCIECSASDGIDCTWNLVERSTITVPPPPPNPDMGGSVGGGTSSISASATGGLVSGSLVAYLPPSPVIGSNVQVKDQESDSGHGGKRFEDSNCLCTCHVIEETLLLSVSVSASALFSGQAHNLSHLKAFADCDWVTTLGSSVDVAIDATLKPGIGTTGSWGFSGGVEPISLGVQGGALPYATSPIPFSLTLTDIDSRVKNWEASELDGLGVVHLQVDMGHGSTTQSSSASASVSGFQMQCTWYGHCTCGATQIKSFAVN